MWSVDSRDSELSFLLSMARHTYAIYPNTKGMIKDTQLITVSVNSDEEAFLIVKELIGSVMEG